MAKTKGMIGYTPDGQGFEEIILDADKITAADGTTVQEHLDDAGRHLPETSVQNAGKVMGTSALGKPSWLSLGSAAEKNTGTASGNVPVVGANGKLDAAIMPALAITDTFVVNSQTAMLALSVEVGDVCAHRPEQNLHTAKGAPQHVGQLAGDADTLRWRYLCERQDGGCNVGKGRCWTGQRGQHCRCH